jgi:hypothetical protein
VPAANLTTVGGARRFGGSLQSACRGYAASLGARLIRYSDVWGWIWTRGLQWTTAGIRGLEQESAVNRPPKPENRSLLIWERGRDPRLTEPADDPASRAANCSTGAAHLREPHKPPREVSYTLRQPLCTFAVYGRQFYAGCAVLSRITSSTTAMAASASGTYSCQFSSRRRSIAAPVHPSSRHASALEVSQIARATRSTRALIPSKPRRSETPHRLASIRHKPGCNGDGSTRQPDRARMAKDECWADAWGLSQPRYWSPATVPGRRSEFRSWELKTAKTTMLFRPARGGYEMLHTTREGRRRSGVVAQHRPAVKLGLAVRGVPLCLKSAVGQLPETILHPFPSSLCSMIARALAAAGLPVDSQDLEDRTPQRRLDRLRK